MGAHKVLWGWGFLVHIRAYGDKWYARLCTALQVNRVYGYEMLHGSHFGNCTPRALNPETLNPKPLNPKPLNPKPLSPKPSTGDEVAVPFPYLEGHGDSVSRVIMGIIRVIIWLIGVINLLPTSP